MENLLAASTLPLTSLLVVPASMSDEVSRDLAKRFYDYLGTDKVSVGEQWSKQFSWKKVSATKEFLPVARLLLQRPEVAWGE